MRFGKSSSLAGRPCPFLRGACPALPAGTAAPLGAPQGGPPVRPLSCRAHRAPRARTRLHAFTAR
eukprot:5783761-Lingulodinium_polyedra.AAC.1